MEATPPIPPERQRELIKQNEDLFNNVLLARQRLATAAGLTFDGKRDVSKALGYPESIAPADYVFAWKRGDLARRIISVYPAATWSVAPDVYDEDDETTTTEFEKEWKRLFKKHKLLTHLKHWDILTGVGEYGVLFLGLNDNADVSQPVGKRAQGLELIYLQAFLQQNATITQWDNVTTSPRYGKPVMYQLTTRTPGAANATTLNVHWTRVIHAAEEAYESPIYGTPRLQSVYNLLLDKLKVSGGGAEMYWQGAFGGIAFTSPAGTNITPEAMTQMKADMQNYEHGLQRFLRLIGVEAKPISNPPADPSSPLNAIIQLIAGAKGIPQRLLTGSEQGELASSQDRSNWGERVKERRGSEGEALFLRPLVERFIELGLLPEPKDGEFNVSWGDGENLSAQERATVQKTKVDTMAAYVSGNVESIMPLEYFLTHILEWDEKLVKEMVEAAQKAAEEKAAEAAEDAKAAAEAAQAAGGGQEPPPPNGTQPPPQKGVPVAGKPPAGTPSPAPRPGNRPPLPVKANALKLLELEISDLVKRNGRTEKVILKPRRGVPPPTSNGKD